MPALLAARKAYATPDEEVRLAPAPASAPAPSHPPPPPPPLTLTHTLSPPYTPSHTRHTPHTPYTPSQVHVYLATDDHTVVEDLPRLNGSRHFTWLVRSSDEVRRRTWPRHLHASMLTMATLLGALRVATRLPCTPGTPPHIPVHPLTGAPHVAARLPRPPLLGAANRAAALAEKGTQQK